jgi:ring-1,2-phenylacetyl-CoA epoxidase subunit PaaB
MPDTQWTRYLVFEQDFPRNPHRLAGSVHAPDAELALLNARDVFVRRPTVISLWIVPADAVFARTAEELANDPDWADKLPQPAGSIKTYVVFSKPDHRGTQEYRGEVKAGSKEQALVKALETFGDDKAVSWWTVPARLVHQSTPEDIELMFEQAKDKPFRHQSNFRVQTKLREWMDRPKDED